MKKPTAIILSDIHLRDTQPICRKDDFWETQKKKLNWLRSFHKNIGTNVPILCAGDVFHEWKTSPKLINMAIDFLPNNIISIPGNHEMPNHNYELMNESGYGVLSKTQTIYNQLKIHKEVFNESKTINIYFFPYGQELYSIDPKSREINIAIAHYFVYKGRKPFPGQLTGVKSLMKQLSGFDLIITGDNHTPFTHRDGDRLLINPGCFSRQRTSEANNQPRVYLWYAENNTFDVEYVPIEDPENVISRKHIEQIEYKNEKIELFVGKLNENIDVKFDFKNNMRQYIKGNPKIKKLTKIKIQEAMQL